MIYPLNNSEQFAKIFNIPHKIVTQFLYFGKNKSFCNVTLQKLYIVIIYNLSVYLFTVRLHFRFRRNVGYRIYSRRCLDKSSFIVI